MPTIDLAGFDSEQGKKELAKKLLDAVNTKGFFYLTNFGISKEEVDRQFGIGSEFYATPLEERMKSRSIVEQGNSNGYRPMGLRNVGEGLTGEPIINAGKRADTGGLCGPQTVLKNTTPRVSTWLFIFR